MSPDGRIVDWKLGFAGGDQKFVSQDGCFITHGMQVADVMNFSENKWSNYQHCHQGQYNQLSCWLLQKLAQGLCWAFSHLKSHGLKVSQSRTWRVMEGVVPVPLRNGCWKNLEVQRQAATNADFQHPASSSLAPAISEHSHLMVCVCDSHRHLPHAGPPPVGAGLLLCLAGTHAGVQARPPLSHLPCRTAGRHG